MATNDFTINPHPDFEIYSQNELKDKIRELADDIAYASSHGAGQLFVSWLITERRLAESVLAKQNGKAGTAPAQGAFWPEPLTSKQFISRPPDLTRWIWENTLASGSTAVVVAVARAGKSTFALNLSLAIARGSEFLGRKTQKMRAFYLSLDNSDNDMREMTERIGLSEHDDLLIHSGAIPEQRLDWLLETIEKNEIKFVVVDTWQRFFGVDNISDYSEAVNKMTPLDNASKRLGFTVMYVHHAPKESDDKSDAALGSTAIKGMCPYYFHIYRMGEQRHRVLKTDFRNGRDYESVGLKIDKASGWLMVSGTLEEIQIEEAIPKIIDFLQTVPESTESELRKNIPLRGLIISKAIRHLYRKQDIDRVGTGRKGNAFRYFLSPALPDGQPRSEPKIVELFPKGVIR